MQIDDNLPADFRLYSDAERAREMKKYFIAPE